MNRQSLCVIGDAFLDMVVPTNGLPKGGAVHKDIAMTPGGTANVAVWARRMGASTKFVGAVGDDPAGMAFREDLRREKVLDLTLSDSLRATGVCISLIDEDGERTMITNRGANDHWNAETMAQLLPAICDSAILYVAGFSLVSGGNAAILEPIVLEAKEKGCRIWFGPGAHNIVGPRMKDFIQCYVNGLILNRREAEALTGQDSAQASIRLLARDVETVIMTLGEAGSLLVTDSETISTPALTVPRVVDTTGAGDAFAAGFLAARVQGNELHRCLQQARHAAADVIQRPGAR